MTCVCGHGERDHGQERAFYECDNSKREVCLMCPGYEYDDGTSGYPRGKAWHRFKASTPSEAALEARDA